MWAIFLLAVIGVALIALGILWVANKVFIAIKKDNFKFEKELEKEGKENE